MYSKTYPESFIICMVRKEYRSFFSENAVILSPTVCVEMLFLRCHVTRTKHKLWQKNPFDPSTARVTHSSMKVREFVWAIASKTRWHEATGERGRRSILGTPGRRNILQAAADWSPDTNSLRWNRKCHVLPRATQFCEDVSVTQRIKSGS